MKQKISLSSHISIVLESTHIALKMFYKKKTATNPQRKKRQEKRKGAYKAKNIAARSEDPKQGLEKLNKEMSLNYFIKHIQKFIY